jgi:hypothetical protein
MESCQRLLVTDIATQGAKPNWWQAHSFLDGQLDGPVLLVDDTNAMVCLHECWNIVHSHWPEVLDGRLGSKASEKGRCCGCWCASVTDLALQCVQDAGGQARGNYRRFKPVPLACMAQVGRACTCIGNGLHKVLGPACCHSCVWLSD